jgi:hypothetical protein
MIERILLKLTALTPVSHGDASSASTGPNNTQLFNRQLQRLSREAHGATEEEAQTAIARLTSAYQIGDGSLPFLESLTGSELIAVLFVANVPLMYGGEGEGLFQGMERYQYLSTRLADACRCCSTLPEAWHHMSLKLKLPMFATQHFNRMSAFFMLPRSIQGQVVNAITKKLELIVMGARLVADTFKATNAEYAKAASMELFQAQTYTPTQEQITELCRPKQEAIVVPVPSLSGNSLRHCMMREPGSNRLISELGLIPYTNQNEDLGSMLSVGITRLLYGGGQLAAKAKAPSSADLLEATLREKYPILDALGGSVDSFLMAESCTKISAWILCEENNEATQAIAGQSSSVSIFDYLEDTTRTRSGIGGKDKDSGQMIFNFESLAAGLPVIVEVMFNPFTRPIVIGSIYQALLDWQVSGGVLGGRSGSGFGKFGMEVLCGDYSQNAEDYLSYLQANKEDLAKGLSDRTLGTKVELCAA